MDVLSAIVDVIRDLLIFVAAMFALTIGLIVVVAKLPDDNPLKRILHALSYRVGATAVAGLVAIPIEPIPGLDALYDIAAPLALLYYWFTFFRGAYRTTQSPRRPPTIIEGEIVRPPLRPERSL